MARAVIESSGYAIKFILEKIESHNLKIKSMRVAGSLSGINLLNRIKADITGRTIFVPEISDSELLGNACIGLTFLGEYGNAVEASSDCVKIKETVKPDPSLSNMYNRMYNIYKSADKSLAEIYKHSV